MYAAGYDPVWAKRYPSGKVVTTPTYPWQRERAWLALSSKASEAAVEPVTHPFLGRRVDATDETTYLWEARIGGDTTAFARDHRLHGVPVLPASAFVEMVVSAACGLLGTESLELLDLEFSRALFLPETGFYQLQLEMRRDTHQSEVRARISGRPEGTGQDWQLHATARVMTFDSAASEGRVGERPFDAAATANLSASECYAGLRSVGLDYGPLFQGIERLRRHGNELLARVRLPEGLEPDPYYFHPAFHDACLHAAALADSVQEHSGVLPVRIARIVLCSRPTTTVHSHARIVDVGDRAVADVVLTSPDGVVIQRVEGIEFAHLEMPAEGEDPTVQWLYEPGWTELSAPRANAHLANVAPGSTWLVLADGGGVGEAIASHIRAAGGEPILARRGPAFRQTGETTFELRLEHGPDVGQLVTWLAARPGPLAGVFHAWSLDLPSVDALAMTELDAAILSSCGSAVNLVRALEETYGDETTPIWFATRGAQPYGLDATTMAPLQAPLWGLGRALAHEVPSRWGGLVDLDPRETPEGAAAQLWASLAITTVGADDEIVWRDGHSYGARLNPVSGSRASRGGQISEMPRDAAVLVTGGTGGLGLAVARWLASRGVKHIVLAARTTLPPREEWGNLGNEHPQAEKVRALLGIEAQGANVEAVSLDVADPDALGRYFEERRLAGLPGIRGVFHLAGTVELVDFLQLDAEGLLGPMRSKVHGTLALHRLLDEVDTFVLFSSASTIIRSPRLGHYAAANAFLDAIAHYRRSLGRPGLAINWGLWSDVGYARRLGKAQGPSSIRAMKAISPSVGIEILERLVARPEVQTFVWPSSWDEWARLYPALAKSPMLAHLRDRQPTVTPDENISRSVPPSAMAVADRQPSILQGYIRELVASHLSLRLDSVPIDQPLEQLGFDSLSATELRNEIRRDFDVKIPVVRLLGAATIETISKAVLESLASASAATVSPGAEEDASQDNGRVMRSGIILKADEVGADPALPSDERPKRGAG
jgi:hybrid polyketide synthase/nonribosomal peptide synthetase FtdB